MLSQKHMQRLVLVVVVVVVGFFLARSLFIPESFGRYGYYRGDNITEQMRLPLVHLESSYCKDCHEPEFDDWQGDTHATVNCEVCHGHWEIHNGRVKTMTAARHDDACLVCHQRLSGRPEAFPQIASLALHLEEQKRTREGIEGCLSCHKPHKPSEVKE